MVALILTFVLTFNYTTNTFNKKNESFAKFSSGSESLVTSGMIAQMRGLEGDYAIGYYESAFGETKTSYRGLDYYNNLCAGITNDQFDRGYSRTQPGVVILGYSGMANSVYESGAKVRFAGGGEYNITEVTFDGTYFYVHTDCDKLLAEETDGMLLDAQFTDHNGEEIVIEKYGTYKSHYGLQGNFFGIFTKFMVPQKVFAFSNLLCSLLTAAVFVAIVLLIYKKYNFVFAACFYSVFLLAPVLVNFARNLYWVEFTWFVPMLAGLLCAVYFDNKKIRMLSFVLAFVSVLIKSLCGYEYISTVLVAMMAFLFADFAACIVKKDIRRSAEYFKVMSVMGVLAVAGFAVAIVMHAAVRGDGNLMAGISEIWHKDVLRRTLGGNPADFSEAYAASLNASVTDVVRLYLNPEPEIISGISGSWFKVLMVLPVAAFVFDAVRDRKLNTHQIMLYLVTFIASMSWFVLAKSHSYEHTHLNVAMWYFGFIQLCIAIPLDRIVKIIKSAAVKK